jgi:sugar lactone lactonase YvrE
VKAQLRQPHSIIFDRNGDLLICDIGNQRIRRLHLGTGNIETYAGTGEAKPTPEGAVVTGTPLKGPRTLAAAPNGDLYVADGYGSSYVNQYDKNGKYIRTFGGPGAGAGQLLQPHGICVDTRGTEPVVTVADRRNNRLQTFTLDGKRYELARNEPRDPSDSPRAVAAGGDPHRALELDSRAVTGMAVELDAMGRAAGPGELVGLRWEPDELHLAAEYPKDREQ